MSTHFVGDTGVLLGRSMRHVFRSMDTIITTAITPIAMLLLFVYVLGGAIETGTDNYVNYLLPGIMLIAIASGIAYTAVRLFTDMKSGIFERFHSMPIARSSVLWAHVGDLAGRQRALGRDHRAGRPRHGIPHLGKPAGMARCCRNPGAVHPGTHLGRRPRRPVSEVRGRCRRILLPADLPAVHQLGLRPHGHHARSRAGLRREPAGHVDRQHDPGPVRTTPRRQRHLDRPRMVPRHPRRRLRLAMAVYRRKVS